MSTSINGAIGPSVNTTASNTTVVSNTHDVTMIAKADIKKMSVQVAAAFVMMEVAQAQKSFAQGKIEDMKEQNERAKKLNAFLDKYSSRMAAVKDQNDEKAMQGASIAMATEAITTGLLPNNDPAVDAMMKAKTKDGVAAAKTQLQHMAENCNSDNQTQMVKLQDFMGQYNSYMQGANDAIKQANQIQQTLSKTQ